LGLEQRTTGILEKSNIVWSASSSIALSDVAGDRNYRAPYLLRETKKVLFGKGTRGGIHVRAKVHGLLPDNQVTIVTNGAHG
jgi:hypothetical protein